MHKVTTTESETETYASKFIERFNKQLELLFSGKRKNLDPVRDKARLQHLTLIQSNAQKKTKECERQYYQNMTRLMHIGRGKKEDLTIRLYTQREELYMRILENSLRSLREDIEKTISDSVQNLKVA